MLSQLLYGDVSCVSLCVCVCVRACVCVQLPDRRRRRGKAGLGLVSAAAPVTVGVPTLAHWQRFHMCRDTVALRTQPSTLLPSPQDLNLDISAVQTYRDPGCYSEHDANVNLI